MTPRSIARCILFSLLASASLVARADVLAHWTSIASQAARDARLAPAEAERGLALATRAMVAASGTGNGHANGNGSSTPAAERRDAAIAAAAFTVLEALYPEQREHLEALLAVTFSQIPETAAKAEGAAEGRRIASGQMRER